MLRINLLGGIDVLDDNGAPLNARIGPKPLALFVYLLVEGRMRTVRRDIAATVLWPESRNARASLTQALYDLRGAFGDETIWSRGKEEIGVDVAHISCDCFDFAELAATGSLEECVSLYRGDFAAGLYPKDAPAFDDWLDQERRRWRTNLARVVCELYKVAFEREELTAAASWAERLIDVAPADDAPVRSLLPVLVERNQTAAAVKLYEVYERKLSEYLEVEPATDITAMVASLRQPRATAHHAPIHIGRPKWLQPRRVRITAGAGGFIVAAAVLGALVKFGPSAAERADTSYLRHVAPPTVAVLPFAHAANDAAARASAVLTEALQWQLRDGGFAVLSGNDSDDVDAAVRLLRTRKSASLAFVVNGAIEQNQDGAVVTRVSVTEASSGKMLWSDEFTDPLADVHMVPSELSNAIAAEIRRVAGRAVEIVPVGVRPDPADWREVYHAQERIGEAMRMRMAGAAAGSSAELDIADNELAGVTHAEPKWAFPWILRGRVAEGRAFTALTANGASGDAAGSLELDRGIRMLDSAIAALPAHDLFEQRGRLKYLRWVFGIDDVKQANEMLASAEADLRKAVEPGDARTVSHLALSGVMEGQGKFAEAYAFARRAYDTDVFLRRNDEILLRLFNTAFEAADDKSADYWCREIQKTQPGHWPSVYCRISIAAYAPDLVNVRGLQAAIEQLEGPPPLREIIQPRLLAAYAATLARNGMPDSAHAVLRQSLPHAKLDPELLPLHAFALNALGRVPQANALLEEYMSGKRGTRSAVLLTRWLR